MNRRNQKDNRHAANRTDAPDSFPCADTPTGAHANPEAEPSAPPGPNSTAPSADADARSDTAV
jgi:hypothetical protein